MMNVINTPSSSSVIYEHMDLVYKRRANKSLWMNRTNEWRSKWNEWKLDRKKETWRSTPENYNLQLWLLFVVAPPASMSSSRCWSASTYSIGGAVMLLVKRWSIFQQLLIQQLWMIFVIPLVSSHNCGKSVTIYLYYLRRPTNLWENN